MRFLQPEEVERGFSNLRNERSDSPRTRVHTLAFDRGREAGSRIHAVCARHRARRARTCSFRRFPVLHGFLTTALRKFRGEKNGKKNNL
ncbi:MAG: hypothetical protein D6679_03180 [Candidatus Hydrogenedentota bacterium]|nr:MAG: hypothetical protein D6679_03180 [Candidatus Hydrogenedentota bacterium]